MKLDDGTTAHTTSAQRWVLGLAGVGAVMVALDALVVASALTSIRRDLHASVEQLQWVVNAYTLSFAMLMLIAAALGDRWGRRRTYGSGLMLFTAASAVCALSASVPVLIAARAAQGVGAAMVMPLAIGLLGAAFPPERRGWATGIFSGLTGLAVLAGPIVGGAITEGLAWQWIFWVNVPIGFVAVALVRIRIPESYGPERKLDLTGALLISAAVLGMVWGVVRGPASGWGSSEVISTLSAGAALFFAFLIWETRTRTPMVPVAFFTKRGFSAGNVAGFLLTGALYGAVFFNAQFMQVVFGSGPFKAGAQLLPWTATLFLVGPISGRLLDRIGERPLIVAGLTCQAIGLSLVAYLGHRHSVHYAQLVLPLMLSGFGVSLAMPATQAASIGALPREAVGIASGIYSMMRQLGGLVGVAVLTAVFAGSGGYRSFHDGFGKALFVSGMLSLVGALAGLWIPGVKTTTATPAATSARRQAATATQSST